MNEECRLWSSCLVTYIISGKKRVFMPTFIAKTKANLGFWRKVLIDKIDDCYWESKKEIPPSLTWDEADETGSQKSSIAIPHLSKTNIYTFPSFIQSYVYCVLLHSSVAWPETQDSSLLSARRERMGE